MEGKRADVFKHEGGGHRWQRIPPTEKRGRIQTSTVTVAVLPVPEEGALEIAERDLEFRFTKAGGPGGQHRQKSETGVVITHKPTGIQAKSENERSQLTNRLWAMEVLRARLLELRSGASQQERNATRRAQIGSGQRGDKIRTIRTQDNSVHCERTGKVKPYRQYAAGDIEF